jgi:N-acetyl-gamma-glutamylphosphate reductase
MNPPERARARVHVRACDIHLRRRALGAAPRRLPRAPACLTTRPATLERLCALQEALTHARAAFRVLATGQVPHTRHVRGSNFNLINVFPDRIPGRAIVISVIDNVCKGASGQAIQNLNCMMGCDESTAINVMPVFP